MKKLLMYVAAITIMLSVAGCAVSAMSAVCTTAPNITDPVIPTTTPNQDIPTTGPENDPTTPDTDPDAMPSDIPHQYWAVLNNEQMIHFPDYQYQQDLFLDDFEFGGMGVSLPAGIKYRNDIEYTVITTVDDQVMLAIRTVGATLVLYEKDGVIYGNNYSHKGMHNLSSNGAHSWHHQDPDGLHYGRSQLCFKDGKFTAYVLYLIDQDLGKYYIGDVEVTYNELKACLDTNSEIEASWSALTRYPLTDAHPGG